MLSISYYKLNFFLFKYQQTGFTALKCCFSTGKTLQLHLISNVCTHEVLSDSWGIQEIIVIIILLYFCCSSLSQLSEHRELRSVYTLGHHPFYEEALQMAEEGMISCRVLR